MKLKKITINQNSTIIINVLSMILVQGIMFISSPIFTRVLGPEQYGKYSVFTSWVSVLSCIIGLGANNALAIAKQKYGNKYYRFRSTALLFSIFVGIVISSIVLLFGKQIGNLLGYGYLLIVALVISAFSQYIISFAQTAFIYEEKPINNLFLSFLSSTLSIVLSLIFVLSIDSLEKYESRIFGNLIPFVVVSIIVIILFFVKGKPEINKEYLLLTIVLGLPIVVHTLSHSILSQSDRFMMELLGVSDSEIGIYSVFYSFGSLLTIILSALNNSWCPYFYDDLSHNNIESIHIKSKNYIEFFSVLTCGFILLSKEVGVWYAGEEYASGVGIIPIITLSVYCTFMYQFYVNTEFYNKQSVVIAVGTVLAALINIALNLLFIPIGGIVAASLTTLVSYFLLFLFHFIIVKILKYENGIKFVSFGPWVVLLSIVTLLYYNIPDRLWLTRWLIGATIGLFELYRIYRRKSIW